MTRQKFEEIAERNNSIDCALEELMAEDSHIKFICTDDCNYWFCYGNLQPVPLRSADDVEFYIGFKN